MLPKIRDPRFITVRRGGSLQDHDHRLLGIWAADCAQHVLHHFEQARPKDHRPRHAIDLGRAWARGEIAWAEARTAAGHANAAAGDLSGAARHAAYAAGQAAAPTRPFSRTNDLQAPTPIACPTAQSTRARRRPCCRRPRMSVACIAESRRWKPSTGGLMAGTSGASLKTLSSIL